MKFYKLSSYIPDNTAKIGKTLKDQRK